MSFLGLLKKYRELCSCKFPNGILDFGSLWVLCLGLCLIHFHKMPLKISPTTRSASHSELCCSSNPSNWSRNSVLEMFATLLSKSEMKNTIDFFCMLRSHFLQVFLYRSDLTTLFFLRTKTEIQNTKASELF